MKNQGKQIIGIIICLAVIGSTFGISKAFNIVSKISLPVISAEALVNLIIMIAFVIAVENLIILILGFFNKKKHRISTILTITSSIVRYASAIIILCWGLAILGVDVATIFASVGVVALVVGFSAESLIEDVITGIFMLFENQYNVGDIIEIGGFRGTVSDIGIRTTCITDPGGNVKIINNSNMKDILNRSDNDSRAIAEIDIPYETDIEEFEKKIPDILKEIYSRHPDMMKKEPVYLGVAKLGASGVTLKFYADVEEKDIYAAQRILNHDLWVLFRKANVEVPFTQVDIHNK
ncbi:MAG: mechanosensitive ion channel [Erysipelotrichaceae bacterium]|nr:mechanosensitive ion channel [Erysipelotrichaceae bacterium]